MRVSAVVCVILICIFIGWRARENRAAQRRAWGASCDSDIWPPNVLLCWSKPVCTVFQHTWAAGERKYMNSDCPDRDRSPREQREGQQPEPDSVTNVCIFSTGNHSWVSLVWSWTERHFPVEDCQFQAANFYVCVINTLVTKQVIINIGLHVASVQQ